MEIVVVEKIEGVFNVFVEDSGILWDDVIEEFDNEEDAVFHADRLIEYHDIDEEIEFREII
jgi:hypothetical protein